MNRNRLKILYYKCLFKFFPYLTNPKLFNKILQLEGIDIGEGTYFFEPNSVQIDRQRPWMLKIGKYCKITHGVTILTHDYSRSVLRHVYGEMLGEARMTIIGNNVFIGMNSIILMGAHIGSNVIIGAGSVIGGDIPDNVVVAGNPVKIIRTLDEHYKKRKEVLLKEARIWFESYYKKYGSYPSEIQSGPFFPLFTSRETFDYENDNRLYCNGDDMKTVIADFMKSKPLFDSYEKFIEYIKSN